MTRTDWLSVVDWISERFSPWSPKQAEAFYDDLKGFDLGAVKEAVHKLYGKGLTRPPTGSQILSLVKEISRDRLDKIPMAECSHLPLDDEGYCAACGGLPKLRMLLDDATDIPLSHMTADTPRAREMLTTVAGNPPDEPTRSY